MSKHQTYSVSRDRDTCSPISKWRRLYASSSENVIEENEWNDRIRKDQGYSFLERREVEPDRLNKISLDSDAINPWFNTVQSHENIIAKLGISSEDEIPYSSTFDANYFNNRDVSLSSPYQLEKRNEIAAYSINDEEEEAKDVLMTLEKMLNEHDLEIDEEITLGSIEIVSAEDEERPSLLDEGSEKYMNDTYLQPSSFSCERNERSSFLCKEDFSEMNLQLTSSVFPGRDENCLLQRERSNSDPPCMPSQKHFNSKLRNFNDRMRLKYFVIWRYYCVNTSHCRENILRCWKRKKNSLLLISWKNNVRVEKTRYNVILAKNNLLILGRRFCDWVHVIKLENEKIHIFLRNQRKRIAISCWHHVLHHRNERISLAMENHYSHLRLMAFMGLKEVTKKLTQSQFEVSEEEQNNRHLRKCKVASILVHLEEACQGHLLSLNAHSTINTAPEKVHDDAKENTIPLCNKLEANKKQTMNRRYLNNNTRSKTLKPCFEQKSDFCVYNPLVNKQNVMQKPSTIKRSPVDVKKKQSESARRRKEIMNKYLRAKKESNMNEMNSACQADERERLLYIRNKRIDRDLARKKTAEIEAIKKAVKLANLHYILSLLKRCLSHHWKNFVQVRRLKACKALAFWKDQLMYRSWQRFIKFVELSYQEQKEIEKKNYKQADIYYQYRLCESVMRLWNQRAVAVHKLFFIKVKRLREYYQCQRILEIWKTKTMHQSARLLRKKQEAQRRGRKSIMMLVINRWNENIVMIKKQQMEEECAKKKWREVKEWIMHL